MVEDIEGFYTKEQRRRLLERQSFSHSHIVVIRARAVEEASLRSAGSSEGIHAEGCGIEIVVIVRARIMVQMKRSASVVRLVDAAVVDPVWIRSDQRVVSIVDHGDGKTARETGDAGKRPAQAKPIGMK